MTALTPTRRLDHLQPLEMNFHAVVRAVRDTPAGPEVALDASAFYPQGGGQNGDRGQLLAAAPGGPPQTWKVTDTRLDKGTGVVWQLLAESSSPPAVGTAVTGQVDAPRRLRQMARHTGEHLLAQAFFRVNPAFEVAAVGMRSPDCTLDLRGHPTEADAQAAEALLREAMVAGPLTLDTLTVPHTSLGAYSLRRATALTGDVRLVIFRDAAGQPFDVSACAGTHLPLGNMAAPVTVLGLESIKAGLTRVTFRAGPEAAEYLSDLYRSTRALAQTFSTGPQGLPERVAALRAEVRGAQAERDQLGAALGATLLRAAPLQPLLGHLSWRGLSLPELSLPEAGRPAQALFSAALADPAANEVRAVQLQGRCAIACGADVPFSAAELLRASLDITGGKGGGRPALAQGQTLQPAQWLAAARRTAQQFSEIKIGGG